MTTAIVKGSVSQIAQATGASLAAIWVDVEVVVLIDCSGSMATPDSVGGRTRHEQACRELETLQGANPGKIGVIAFNSYSVFRPGGVPMHPAGGTDLAAALQYAKVADVPGVRFVLISDGEPNEERAALQMAQSYKARIDCIYVGSEAQPFGRDFLRRLSEASGGGLVTAGAAIGLANAVQRLLN